MPEAEAHHAALVLLGAKGDMEGLKMAIANMTHKQLHELVYCDIRLLTQTYAGRHCIELLSEKDWDDAMKDLQEYVLREQRAQT